MLRYGVLPALPPGPRGAVPDPTHHLPSAMVVADEEEPGGGSAMTGLG